MTTDTTTGQDQTQANPVSQTDTWEARYNGLTGKVQQLQNQLNAATAGKTELEAKHVQLAQRAQELEGALSAKDGELATLTGKLGSLNTDYEAKLKESETLAAQLARQSVMLEFPQLVSEPVLKLVQASSLSADELKATLAAMAEGQQHAAKQVFEQAQLGSTGAVSPAAGQANAREEQAQSAWNEAITAMQKGDMKAYQTHYNTYLSLLDQINPGGFSQPAVLKGRTI